MKNNYFKKTFVLAFVFIFIIKILDLLFEGIDTFTVNSFLKVLFVSFGTALILGTLNHFLKLDIYKKK